MKYIKLFENINFDEISKDIDFMDIDEQDKIIKKLKNFTFKKLKELNARKKVIKNKEIYNRIKDIYEHALDSLKDTYLKKIDFNNIEDFKIKRTYNKKINKIGSIEKELDNNKSFKIDGIIFTFYNININIRLHIIQYINTKKELFYNVSLYVSNRKYMNFEKNIYDMIFSNKEKFNDYINKFKNNLDNLIIDIKATSYNL